MRPLHHCALYYIQAVGPGCADPTHPLIIDYYIANVQSYYSQKCPLLHLLDRLGSTSPSAFSVSRLLPGSPRSSSNWLLPSAVFRLAGPISPLPQAEHIYHERMSFDLHHLKS